MTQEKKSWNSMPSVEEVINTLKNECEKTPDKPIYVELRVPAGITSEGHKSFSVYNANILSIESAGKKLFINADIRAYATTTVNCVLKRIEDHYQWSKDDEIEINEIDFWISTGDEKNVDRNQKRHFYLQNYGLYMTIVVENKD